MMKEPKDQAREAAQLLGRRGGMATLKKYGAKKLRRWGELGKKFGKLGGRPTGNRKRGSAKRRIER